MNGSVLIPEHEASTAAPIAAPLAACASCGVTLAPSGTCLEIGACREADAIAARRSSVGATSKFAAIPSAWNARGGVD